MSPIGQATGADRPFLHALARHAWKLLAALLLLAGCSNVFDSPYPVRLTYLLQAPPPQMPDPSDPGPVLLIRRFTVNPAFAGQSFVIRKDGGEFEDDFYNTFIVPPAQAIASVTARWLRESGLFRTVISGPSELQPGLVLEATIPALYGDFRGRPTAILEIDLRVIEVRSLPGTILYAGNFRRAVPIETATPVGLVQGWDAALVSILSEFANKLGATLSRDPSFRHR